MSHVGSCDRTAEIAARALADLGCTRLQIRLGAHVASFGGNCFQTDASVRAALAGDGGHLYHRESIGRARRALGAAGILKIKRIFSGQRPKGARNISPHGTTSKWIRWDRLGVVDPSVRRDAAIDRNVRQKAKRAEIAQEIERRGRPRHSAPVPPLVNYATRTPEPDAELAAELDRFRRVQSDRVARRTTDTPDSVVPPHGPGPPKST